MQATTTSIDQLYEAIRCIQKCLECTICLETISMPVKTRCGHSFCHSCIASVLSKKNAVCPLCKTNLKRRSTSNDEHLEMCILRLQQLVSSIQSDSGINILSHRTQPCNTKESCSTSGIGNSSIFETSIVGQNIKENQKNFSNKISALHTDKKSVYQPSRAQITANDAPPRDSIAIKSNIEEQQNSPIARSLFPDDNQNDSCSILEDEVNTRFEHFSDIKVPSDSNNKLKGKSSHAQGNLKVVRLQSDSVTDPVSSNNLNESKRSTKDDNRMKRTCGNPRKRRSLEDRPTCKNNAEGKNKGRRTMNVDSTDRDLGHTVSRPTGGLPKSTVNPIAAKSENVAKSNIGTDQNKIDSTKHADNPTTAIESASTNAPSVSTMITEKDNWSRVTKLGKEMRTKKRKMKSLNVSIESRNTLKPSQETVRQDNSDSRLSKNTKVWDNCDKGGSDANTFKDTNEHCEVDKSRKIDEVGSPSNQIVSKKIRYDVNTSHEGNKDENDESISECVQSAAGSSFITFDKGEQVHITHLNSDQMNEIIGITSTESDIQIIQERYSSPKDSALSLKKRCEMRNAACGETTNACVSPLKANVNRRTEVGTMAISNKRSIPDSKMANRSSTAAEENRTSPTERHEFRKISEMFSPSKVKSPKLVESPTPGGKLSLKRKVGNSARKNEVFRNSDDVEARMKNTTKRDLTREIADSGPKDISRKRLSPVCFEEKNKSCRSNKREVNALDAPGRVSNDAKQNALFGAGVRNKERRGCRVAFRKLGKVSKRRNQVCKFLYLGFTKHERAMNTFDGVRMLDSITRASVDSAYNDNLQKSDREDTGTKGTSTLTSKPVIGSADVTEIKMPSDKKSTRVEGPIEPRSTENDKREEKSEESLEILYVSLPSTDAIKEELYKTRGLDEDSRCNESRIGTSKPKITSIVQIQPPTGDYKLKHSGETPPSRERMDVEKLDSVTRTPNENAIKHSNVANASSNLKSVRSKADLREPEKSETDHSDHSDHSATLKSKKKRLIPRNKLKDTSRRSMENIKDSSDESDFEYTYSSAWNKSHQRKMETSPKMNEQTRKTDFDTNSNKDRAPSRFSTGINPDMLDSPSSNSEADIIEEKPRSKKYNKIARPPDSDTDATHFSCTETKNKSSKHGKENVYKRGEATRTDNLRTTSSLSSKRKRSDSEDSLNDDDVSAILHHWCSNIETSQKSVKKGKVTESDAFSKPKRSSFSSSNSTIKSNVPNPLRDNLSRRADDQRANKKLNARDKLDSPKDCFNDDIIERVRQIQKTNSSPDKSSDVRAGAQNNEKQADQVDPNMINDNFDDVIANVDSADFLADFNENMNTLTARNENISTPTKVSSKPLQQKAVDRQSLTNATTVINRNASPSTNESQVIMENFFVSSDSATPCRSDKKTHDTPPCTFQVLKDSPKKDHIRCQRNAGSVAKSDTNEKTPTVEKCLGANDRRINAKQGNLFENGSRAKRSTNDLIGSQTNEEIASKKSCTQKLKETTFNERDIENRSIGNNDEETNSYDQDSLLDITQQQMLFKEFEEVLFDDKHRRVSEKNSKKTVSQQEMKMERELRTPETTKNPAHKDVESRRVKDTECTIEEDDIVENTPDTKLKSNPSNLISTKTVRRNLSKPQTTAVSRSVERASMNTPSSRISIVNARTPQSIMKMIPLGHSTPKVMGRLPTNTISSTENTRCLRTANVKDLLEKQRKQDINGYATHGKLGERTLCVVGSGLLESEVKKLKEFAERMGGTFTCQFTTEVTHVVVKCKENNVTAKTLKYLQGIAHGKWIVSYKWVLDCIEQSRLVNEEPYEAVDNPTLEPGPRKSRLREKDLFEGFAIWCVPPFKDITPEQYKDLLLSTGAAVVDTLNALIAERKKLKFIVFQDETHVNNIINWYRKARVVPITHEWIVECISEYRLTSLYTHLQELTPQDVRALGYPEELLEEEEFDSDVSS